MLGRCVLYMLSQRLRGHAFVRVKESNWCGRTSVKKGFVRDFTGSIEQRLCCNGLYICRRGYCKGGSKVEGSIARDYEDFRQNLAEDHSNWDLIEESVFREITKGDPELEQKLMSIVDEINFLRANGEFLPTKFRERDWVRLLECFTLSQRRKILTYLAKTEKKAQKDDIKKQQSVEYRRQRRLLWQQENHLKYGLGHMSMLMRIYESRMNRILNHRLLGALMYSQPIIFDCSYDSYMSKVNQLLCGTQMLMAFFTNRQHPAPFHVKLCNVAKDSAVLEQFQRSFPGLLHEDFPWDIHEESYMDLYPKEKLVYLSPHARNVLHEYNHDDIYIIGAFVDKGIGVKASLAKANENKIRLAKLPLDHYLTWKCGGKSLPINIVLSIMLDKRLYNQWDYALKNVPSRFLSPPRRVAGRIRAEEKSSILP